MKNGRTETIILVIGALITLTIVGAVFFNKSRIGSPGMLAPVTPTINPVMEEQLVSELDKSIDEGLFLELSGPVDGTTVVSPLISVAGRTEANAEVFINEKELVADYQGNFTTSLTLEEGDNFIVVTASDDEGNYSERTISVSYEIKE